MWRFYRGCKLTGTYKLMWQEQRIQAQVRTYEEKKKRKKKKKTEKTEKREEQAQTRRGGGQTYRGPAILEGIKWNFNDQYKPEVFFFSQSKQSLHRTCVLVKNKSSVRTGRSSNAQTGEEQTSVQMFKQSLRWSRAGGQQSLKQAFRDWRRLTRFCLFY